MDECDAELLFTGVLFADEREGYRAMMTIVCCSKIPVDSEGRTTALSYKLWNETGALMLLPLSTDDVNRPRRVHHATRLYFLKVA